MFISGCWLPKMPIVFMGRWVSSQFPILKTVWKLEGKDQKENKLKLSGKYYSKLCWTYSKIEPSKCLTVMLTPVGTF